jgi:nucleotide-binding universal stress UspA family protein
MSQQIKKVLLPVDGSPFSMKATEYAIDFVKNYQAEIILIHCHRAFPSYLGEPLFQEMISSTLDKANRILEPYKKKLADQNISFTDHLFEEPVGKMIAEVASSKKADLIIMGTRGKTDLEGLIIGSVTHQVLHLAHCPVLVIR